METRHTLFVAVLAALATWVNADAADDAKAHGQCMKNGAAGTAIEKILNSNPTKTFYEVYDSGRHYRYEIGLCSTVGDDSAAVIQYNVTNKNQKYVIGKLPDSHVIKRRDYVELEYFKGQQYTSHCHNTHRTARIMFVCDPCGGVGAPVVVEERTTSSHDSSNAHCFYLFEWPTQYACSPDRGFLVVCSAANGVGGIVVLVLLGLLVTYILLGVLYKRMFLGAKGIEQFPHIDHWRMCGNLIADGCDCLCRRKRPTKPSYAPVYTNEQLENMEDSETEDDNDLLPLS